MRKYYISPVTELVCVENSVLLAGSDGVNSNNGLGYGGVDNDGNKDPAAKGQGGSISNIWDKWDD